MTTKAQTTNAQESPKPPLSAVPESPPLATTNAGQEDDEGDDIDWKDVRLPFWNISIGALLLGEVVDIHRDVKGKFHNRDCLDILLLRDTVVSAGKKSTRTAEKGSVVRLEVRAAMGQLADIVEVGDKVKIKCTGKVPTDKGNDAWAFDVKHATGEKNSQD